MQSINVVVLKSSFLGMFFGTTVLSLGAAGLAFASWGHPSAPFFLGGAIGYLAGTFLVTVLGNVPLNPLQVDWASYSQLNANTFALLPNRSLMFVAMRRKLLRKGWLASLGVPPCPAVLAFNLFGRQPCTRT